MIRNVVKLSCVRSLLTVRAISSTPFLSPENTQIKNAITVDEKEIKQFQKFAEDWWGENSPMKPLHLINEIRIPNIQDELRNRGFLDPKFAHTATPLKNLNILDAGCGGGFVSEPITQLGAKVTAVDPCGDLVKYAKIHADQNPELRNKINYIHGTVEDLVEDNKNKFDVVLSMEILDHVASIDVYLKSCMDALKPGGSLILSTINRTFTSWFYFIFLAEYIFKFIPKGSHEWNKFVPPELVLNILEKNNFEVLGIKGYSYNFIKKRWSWANSTSISYTVHAVKR